MSAQFGEGSSEFNHSIELCGIASGTPIGVIPILLAASRVARRGLNMASWIETDPHIRISGRNGESADSRKRFCAANGFSVGPYITKPGPTANTCYARLLVGNVN